MRLVGRLLAAALLCASVTVPAVPAAGADGAVPPALRRSLIAFYDFRHPVPGDPAKERDRGRSGTDIDLVNGAARMRVRDPARGPVLQTMQVNSAARGNDDWKAGIFAAPGAPSLRAFNAVQGTTIMGWFKMTGQNPGPNTQTPDPGDFFGAVGLAGILAGNSQGHDVRALLEVIAVQGTLRVVALGRRVDGGSSQTFAADEDWRTILPQGEWVFLAATFDFDAATMKLYKNGRPLDGFLTVPGDPWLVNGPPEPDLASATDPRGIKIGGSFPQNTEERNPCNCRHDDLMFLDRVSSEKEILKQYLRTRHH